MVVAIVAAAQIEEIASERNRLARGFAFRIDGRSRVGGRPCGAGHAMLESNLAMDSVLARCVANVAEYRETIGKGSRIGPRPESVAERVHIGVRPYARIAKQVPCAADRVARLEDRVAPGGATVLQVVFSADSGVTRANHEHIEMFSRRPLTPLLPFLKQFRLHGALSNVCPLRLRRSFPSSRTPDGKQDEGWSLGRLPAGPAPFAIFTLAPMN
jgi:hypothetical protein